MSKPAPMVKVSAVFPDSGSLNWLHVKCVCGHVSQRPRKRRRSGYGSSTEDPYPQKIRCQRCADAMLVVREE